MLGLSNARGALIAAIGMAGLLSACGSSQPEGPIGTNSSVLASSTTSGSLVSSMTPMSTPAMSGAAGFDLASVGSVALAEAVQLADEPTGRYYVHDIPGRQLGSTEIVQAAAGNSMIGPRLSVFFHPNGQAEMQIFSETYDGSWRVNGDDMMCQRFPDFRPWSSAEVCYEWYLDGNRLSTFEPMTGAGATKGENLLVAGNVIR